MAFNIMLYSKMVRKPCILQSGSPAASSTHPDPTHTHFDILTIFPMLRRQNLKIENKIIVVL